MIRNRYDYLTPSIQDIKKKEGRTYSNGTTVKTLQAESQRNSFCPHKNGQTHHKNMPI